MGKKLPPATTTEIEAIIIDRYVSSAYQEISGPDQGSRFQISPDRARRYLSMVSRLLRSAERTDIAWWELPECVPLFRLKASITAGLFGVAAVAPPSLLVAGVETGLLMTGAVGLTLFALGVTGYFNRQRPPSVPISGSIRSFARTFRVGIISAAMMAAMTYISVAGPTVPVERRVQNPASMVSLGAALGALVGVSAGATRSMSSQDPLTPVAAIRSDRISILYSAAAAGLMAFVGGSIFAVIRLWGMGVREAVLVGVLSGVIFALIAGVGMGVFSLLLSQWLRFRLAVVWFALSGTLPWQVINFLEDACSRGLMKKSGARYQFRHAHLYEYFIALDWSEAAPWYSGWVRWEGLAVSRITIFRGNFQAGYSRISRRLVRCLPWMQRRWGRRGDSC